MLRNFFIQRSAVALKSTVALHGYLQQKRLFAVAPTTRLLSGSKTPNEEDKEELERERLLRERFAQKIHQGVPGSGFEGQAGGQSGGASSNFGGAGFQAPPGMPNPEVAQKLFRFLFYTTALLFLLVLYPFTDRNSPMFTMQGLPWWELPVSSASCFLLLRALYPRAKENEIKEEFEAAARLNPGLTFDSFIWNRYPNLFDGYANNQHMAIAMVATSLSQADTLDFAKKMFIAARNTKDVRKSVDDIVEALSRYLAEPH